MAAKLNGMISFAALGIGLAMVVPAHAQSTAPLEPIYETNVTGDLAISSGEPQIAVDPNDSKNIAIVEFAIGSKEVPAWTMNPITDPRTPQQRYLATRHNGRVMISNDRGQTWSARVPPAYDPEDPNHKGGGDPMIAYGPDGTLYVADCVNGRMTKLTSLNSKPGELDSSALVNVNMFIVASFDGGKTFTPPQPIETPRDRPWLKVDASSGTVYTASFGPFNPKTKEYNAPGTDAPFDRWLTAWNPHLTGHSQPRRMGGPDFSAASGSTMDAALGTLGAVFLLGPPAPLDPADGHGEAKPVPASLRPIMKNGVTSCSIDNACLFFQTSNDEGRTWTRHHVPVPGGITGSRPWTNVSVDPSHPGRFAISVVSRDGLQTSVLVTEDNGETWLPPSTIPKLGHGKVFKQWMDYGASGVLGYMWKEERPDLTTPPPGGAAAMVGRTWGPAFDVYAAISCDGGTTWLPSVRVNAEPSPSGPNGFDDFSYLELDRNYAHLVWGDRRNIGRVKNAPTGVGGIQTYYARIPFATLSKGQQCGLARM